MHSFFNEATTIKEILRRVQEVPVEGWEKELIIVDDGSQDGTREILRNEIEPSLSGGKVFYHERNQGKGAAIQTGLTAVTGDIVLIQDADLEYDPHDYPHLVRPIVEGVADVVYGTRFLGGTHRVLFFWHFMGNRCLTFISNMLTNLNLSDMETGYKVFRAEVIKQIPLKSKRFGFEPEITAKISKRRCRVYEVPISYFGRDYSEGKKITWKDGLVAIGCIVRYRLWD
ncbi:MAG: glycosyltransferase family 2 protein [candidate division WOR-3 bacterium]